MNFDGVAEELAIREHLSDLAGGRIVEDASDDESIPIDTVGKCRPFIELSIGVPFPQAGAGRAFADGEKDIPYTLTFVVGCHAGDRDSLNALYRAVVGRLVDWTPVEANDTAIKIRRAINASSKATKTRPAIVSKIVAMALTINMASE